MFLLTGAQEPDVKFIYVNQATLSYQILIFHMWSKKVRHDFYWVCHISLIIILFHFFGGFYLFHHYNFLL
ncbi:hypothetical protein ACB092_08G193900 [Castanea dentata]